MWIANRWKEFALLEASDGEKLEDWAGYILIRPDPQIIWKSEKKNKFWQKPNAHYYRSSTGGGRWEFFDLPKQWDLHYVLKSHGQGLDESGRSEALTFHLKPFTFKHTGVFPEQATNWEFIYDKIRYRSLQNQALGKNKPVRVLTLFAYTGGSTMAAAKANAMVTHVDASKGMVSWARENALSSGLSAAHIRYLADDAKKFVAREIRRGNKYDAIIMDPPSYGRGPKGELWKLEDDLFFLLRQSSELLSDDPLFFIISSFTKGLAPGILKYMIELVCKGGRAESSEIGLPLYQSKLVLPAGCSCRYIF